ncbi:hypothetical protein BT93_A2422 [Corymbia citriodora subsp. variegata]|nr:hypothetical protein BT93_A2422 [Corymbia citriodora subsp. variegata]
MRRWLVQVSRSGRCFLSSSTPLPPVRLSSRRNARSGPSVPLQQEKLKQEGQGFSYGLNWALAGKGVIVKDKAFYNLMVSELHQEGATVIESISGLPVLVRGRSGGASEFSKAQSSKLLKQICSHISSISNIYVYDGAIGSLPKCDAKVRVISDSPSAILSLSNVLWETPVRAVSHDCCPLTIYVASSISLSMGSSISLDPKGHDGFIAADVDRSSVILTGKAFADIVGVKEALTAVSEPIICARGGLPLSARLLVHGFNAVLLFAPEATIQSCKDQLVSADAGVIVSSEGTALLFPTRYSNGPNVYKIPVAIVLASSDSTGTLPPSSKLTPEQAAYHFLAGYQNGTFTPVYSKGSSVNPLELAKALLAKLKENQISCFLVNVSADEKAPKGNEFMKLVQPTLFEKVPPFEPKGGYLKAKYQSFLSAKFPEIPEEFCF